MVYLHCLIEARLSVLQGLALWRTKANQQMTDRSMYLHCLVKGRLAPGLALLMAHKNQGKLSRPVFSPALLGDG